MHKSESRVNPTLINCVMKVYELERGPLEPIGVLASLKSNFEVDYVGNLGLFRFHALDIVRCMHLSLRLFRSNEVKNNDFKTILE